MKQKINFHFRKVKVESHETKNSQVGATAPLVQQIQLSHTVVTN